MPPSGADIPSADTIKAWQCIGCGRLEAPQDCIGVCEYRKVEIVGARDYADVRFALDRANERIAALEKIVLRLARVTPRDGAWKNCYLALQAAAHSATAVRDDTMHDAAAAMDG